MPQQTAQTPANRLRKIGLAGLIVVLLVLSGVALIRIPGPLVDKLLEDDMRGQADLWRKRVVTLLEGGNSTFSQGRINPKDLNFLEMITRTSDVYRFKLIDARGMVFWSSRVSDIGKSIGVDVLGEISAGKGANFSLAEKPVSEIDAIDLHATRIDANAPRTVAEIYMPVMQDGAMVGAIEFYHDVTEVRNAFVPRVQTVIALLAGIIGTLFLATLRIVQRSGRARLHDVSALAASEREIMETQLRLTREVKLLGELNEWLQSSRSLEELFDLVARFMGHLLPGAAGSIYVYSNSRDVLDGAASWNGGACLDHIHPEDCWGLRRGRTYAYGNNEVEFECAHVHDPHPRPYFCFPILAHGETVGMMHLMAQADTSAETFEAQRRLAQMSAEQISMAIANVRMRDQLHHQAIRDPLTGLFNRRHLTETLRHLIETRPGSEFSIVSIDVDHFKTFNDNHGHDAGDMVLRAVGEVMQQACNGDQIACRIGGEEFVLLLPGLGVVAAAEHAEDLRLAVAGVSVRYGEKNLPRITISIGVAQYPDHGKMPQDVIRVADDALYEAKAKGRNQVVLADLKPDDSGRGKPDSALRQTNPDPNCEIAGVGGPENPSAAPAAVHVLRPGARTAP